MVGNSELNSEIVYACLENDKIFNFHIKQLIFKACPKVQMVSYEWFSDWNEDVVFLTKKSFFDKNKEIFFIDWNLEMFSLT